MKNLFFVLISGIALLLPLSFQSCNSEIDDSDVEKVTPSKNTDVSSKIVVYHAEWDEWGTKRKNCKGWGLCNFRDCWFCDPETFNSRYSGKVEFDDVTRRGYLIIELDPSEGIQNDAIRNKSIFYVDEDINNANSILHKGEYRFNPLIGRYGGYKVNITVK